LENIKKNILLTGSRGFIGKNLIRRLSKKYFIYATTSKNIKNKKNIEYINYTKKNLSNLKNLKIEYLINCHGKISDRNYDDIYNDHYLFTKNLLNNINKKFLKKIIHLGSVDEYGNNISGKDRFIKKKPESKYGQVKLMVSKLIKDFAKNNKIDFIIFRIFLVYGLGQKKPRLIPYLLYCLKNSKTANISDITAKKTFTHINELSQIIEIVLIKKMKFNIYNLSTSKYISIKKVVNYLNKNFDLKYVYKINKYPKSQFLENCKLFKEIKIKKYNFFNSLNQMIKNEI